MNDVTVSRFSSSWIPGAIFACGGWYVNSVAKLTFYKERAIMRVCAGLGHARGGAQLV